MRNIIIRLPDSANTITNNNNNEKLLLDIESQQTIDKSSGKRSSMTVLGNVSICEDKSSNELHIIIANDTLQDTCITIETDEEDDSRSSDDLSLDLLLNFILIIAVLLLLQLIITGYRSGALKKLWFFYITS